MKYLYLVYGQEERLADLAASSGVEECLAYAETLSASGRLIAWEALASVHAATTVRVRDGKVLVSDGPFADTSEALAGFYLTDARDLNEAIQIAARIPAARVGSVEVRPIRELNRASMIKAG